MIATRRLAAILAADVVGYSRLMGEDETGRRGRRAPIARRRVQRLRNGCRAKPTQPTAAMRRYR